MSLTRSLLVLALLGGSAPTKNAKAGKGMPQKLQQTAAAIVEAALAGDPKAVWDHLHPTATKMKKEVRAPFEKALADGGLPNMASLLLRARLAAQSRGAKIPEPDLKERVLLLTAASEEIEASLKFAAEHPSVQGKDPMPKTMNEYEDFFRELGTISKRLSVAESLAGYGIGLRKKIDASSLSRLTVDDREMVDRIDDDTLAAVQLAEQGLTEIGLELRLARFEYGIELLRKPDLTEDRFKAAYSTQVDGKVLQDEVASRNPGVKQPSPPFLHERLKKLQISELTAQLKQAADLAGPLAEKAKNLFLGLQWWLRGRYGSGPDIGGLAKSAKALNDPQALSVVNMPEPLPEPGVTVAQPRLVKQPYVDRRHHYTWAWEDRKLARSFSASKVSTTTIHSNIETWWYPDRAGITFGGAPIPEWRDKTVETSRSISRRADVPPQDPRLVFRLVGFFEYVQALERLDKFVEQASIAELEVGDKIVRDQAPFALETNLSRAIEEPGPLSETGVNPRDDFVRRGLAWALALARVELGAMLAGFTSHQNPFLALSPTTYAAERVRSRPYGVAEYGEVLMDALRTHYWALQREQAAKNYYKEGVPENHLLTYTRRALIGRQLVRAISGSIAYNQSEQTSNTPAQVTLKAWDESFQKIQRIMLYCLTYKVGNETVHLYKWSSSHVRRDNSHRDANLTLLESSQSKGEGAVDEKDPVPEKIRNFLLTIDPTLAVCPCR